MMKNEAITAVFRVKVGALRPCFVPHNAKSFKRQFRSTVLEYNTAEVDETSADEGLLLSSTSSALGRTQLQEGNEFNVYAEKVLRPTSEAETLATSPLFLNAIRSFRTFG